MNNDEKEENFSINLIKIIAFIVCSILFWLASRSAALKDFNELQAITLEKQLEDIYSTVSAYAEKNIHHGVSDSVLISAGNALKNNKSNVSCSTGKTINSEKWGIACGKLSSKYGLINLSKSPLGNNFFGASYYGMDSGVCYPFLIKTLMSKNVDSVSIGVKNLSSGSIWTKTDIASLCDGLDHKKIKIVFELHKIDA